MNRVLLIDDDNTSCETLQRQFSSLGFSVMSVGSLDAAHAMEAAPDFVLFRRNQDYDTVAGTTGAWIYQLHENAPAELRATPQGVTNENTLFWHRRLQRAVLGSSWSSSSTLAQI